MIKRKTSKTSESDKILDQIDCTDSEKGKYDYYINCKDVLISIKCGKN